MENRRRHGVLMGITEGTATLGVETNPAIAMAAIPFQTTVQRSIAALAQKQPLLLTAMAGLEPSEALRPMPAARMGYKPATARLDRMPD